MAVTKTKFINYIRCPRYVALDDFKKNKLDSSVSFSIYREEEQEEYLHEILETMYDDEGNDLLDVKDEQMEVMLPYYNEVESLAGNLAPKYFKGNFKFAYDTKEQESFDFKLNGIRYLCYVDIYNEVDDAFNIIEVKATTIKKFLNLGINKKDEFGNKENISIFKKDKDGIYYLLEDLGLNIEDYMSLDKYNKEKQKLFNRLDKAGHYAYDLAVQRYIIENDLKQNNMKDKTSKIKYYLALLNSEYVFDGTYENNEPSYSTDQNGNDIIAYIDLTNLTKDYMDIIDIDRKRIESYINNLCIDKVPIGNFCENKRTTKCKYMDICWKMIPKKNSILNYIDNHHGFKDEFGTKYETFDLINNGIVKMVDVPRNYLNRPKNVIQRQVVETHEIYMDVPKIVDGLKQLKYPIYHLDFETFPCPLPRYRGERPYSQSVFQFSLHIETSPDICDKEKNHYEYLAKNHSDCREELIQKMLDYIKLDGTVLVYNESFEKTRLKELGEIFPKYKNDLNKMRNMIFDLMYIIKTKSSLYEELGYSKERATLFNYYHENMNGSFSIKKVLPLFSDLTYDGMDIANGIEALVAYATFPKLSTKEFKYKYNKLIEYCKQDTWAMVEILKGLRVGVNKCQIFDKVL